MNFKIKDKDKELSIHTNEEGEWKDMYIMFSDGTGLIRISQNMKDSEAIISSLSVDEKSRNKGKGTALLSFALCVLNNAFNTELSVFNANWAELKVLRGSWMEEWYKKFGFKFLCQEDEYDWLIKEIKRNYEQVY